MIDSPARWSQRRASADWVWLKQGQANRQLEDTFMVHHLLWLQRRIKGRAASEYHDNSWCHEDPLKACTIRMSLVFSQILIKASKTLEGLRQYHLELYNLNVFDQIRSQEYYADFNSTDLPKVCCLDQIPAGHRQLHPAVSKMAERLIIIQHHLPLLRYLSNGSRIQKKGSHKLSYFHSYPWSLSMHIPIEGPKDLTYSRD